MGRDDGTGKAITTVKTDTVATSRSIDLDLSRVRREAFGWVLGGNTALNSKAARGDLILRQAKLLQRRTSSNLNLSSNNVDARDFFGDCVLDLAKELFSDLSNSRSLAELTFWD